MRSLMMLMTVLIGASAAAQPPAKVMLDEVRLETIEQMRRVTGELRAQRRSNLATQEEGLVVYMGVQEGDTVEQSQVIARLDAERLDLELERLRAELASLDATVQERQAEAERAETELGRLRKLRDEGSASAQELDDGILDDAAARARLVRAEADVVAAARSIDLLDKQLRDMEVRAPFRGRVVRLMTEVGQWLNQGDGVLSIYDTDSIEAWIDVPERYIGRVTDAELGEAPPVSVIIEALGLSRVGRIVQIVPDADPLSRLFPVRIAVENEDGFLRPGMSVVAEVPTGAKAETMTVHKDAILRNDAGEFVYMAGENPRGEGLVAMPMQIDRVFAVGNRVAIRRGALQPGMRVVIEGNERMFPMQPLMVQSETGPARDAEPTQANAANQNGEG